MPASRERGDAAAERARELRLVFGERLRLAEAGDVARAIGRAAAARRIQARLGVGQAGHHHAVVEQRQHHRQQRRFLAAVHRRGRRERDRGLADQRAARPFGAERVEEVLERRGHVAEAGRAAEGEPGAFDEVAALDVRRAVDRHRRRGHRGDGRDRGHRAQARREPGFLDPARDLPRQLRDRAGAAVVEDEDLVHARLRKWGLA
jgi:hypothetical protein